MSHQTSSFTLQYLFSSTRRQVVASMARPRNFTKAALTNALRNKHYAEVGPDSTVKIVTMTPNLDAVEEVTRSNMPGLLIRAYSDSSAGYNGPSGFQSHAMRLAQNSESGESGAVDFNLMSEQDIRSNLIGQLSWCTGSRKNPFSSHWISMTNPFFSPSHTQIGNGGEERRMS